MTMMRTNQTRMNLKLTTRMMTTRMNRKLRTKMNRSVRSGPTATLTKNATFPLLEELPDKNARSLKCADVRSGPTDVRSGLTATLPKNATLLMLEAIQKRNASMYKNATELIIRPNLFYERNCILSFGSVYI